MLASERVENMASPPLEHGMNLDSLIENPSPKARMLLNKALEFMTHTKDPSHGIEHLVHLIKNTERFFKSTGDQFDIDKEILLLALYWHDVWKSQNRVRVRNYLFHQWYEGLGSMLMFKKHARTAGLPQRTERAVSYAIRKHSALASFPAMTLEARLLWDVDTLDLWNSQRIQAIFKNLEHAPIFFLDAYLLYMKKRGAHLYFDWTKKEVERIKPFFFEEMASCRESLVR